MTRRSLYAALLLLTCALGLLVRFAALSLPHAVRKYGGSAFWAMAIFWLVSLFAAPRSTASRASASLLLAFLVEFFKLVRAPALDAFRLTLPGKLLLGRYFSVRDLLAYAAAISVAVALDVSFFRERSASAVR
jgi:hypothetical protein